MVFAALRRERPYSGGKIVELAPAHAADLLTTRTGQDQQASDPTKVVIAAGAPYRLELGVREHPLARLRFGGFARTDDRIGLRPTLLHRPTEERRDGTPSSGRRVRAVLAGDGREPGRDIGVGNL